MNPGRNNGAQNPESELFLPARPPQMFLPGAHAFRRFSPVVCLLVSLGLLCSASAMNPADQGAGYRASRLFPHHGFPVVTGASPDLSHNVNREFERESVEYTVVRPFPPDEVVSMYDRRFRDMGLVPDPEEGYPMRRWESIDPDSRTWRRSTAPPARYVAAWADERRTVRTLLILRYEKKPGDPLWRERLHVHLSHQRLFRLRDILPWR